MKQAYQAMFYNSILKLQRETFDESLKILQENISKCIIFLTEW